MLYACVCMYVYVMCAKTGALTRGRKPQVVDGRVEGLEPSRTLGDFDVKMQAPGIEPFIL